MKLLTRSIQMEPYVWEINEADSNGVYREKGMDRKLLDIN